MADLLFEGFTRPQANFYRLPTTWFDTLRILREQQNRRRIVALVRLTEYIIKWTWGQGNFDRPVHLTLDELQNGKVLRRRNGHKVRADDGTGLPRKTLIPTIEDALAYGLLERRVDDSDRARIHHYYGVRLASEEPSLEAGPFGGFPNPTTNYFIVPNLWTDLTAGGRSDVLILAVEYLFRHCWNWSRQDEVHWLSSDEIANGRFYVTHKAVSASPERYDAGIGYSERKVRDALALAVENEWVVWRVTTRDGRARSEYTLRRLGWPPGEWQAAPAADAAPQVGEAAGPNVTSEGPNVTSGGPKSRSGEVALGPNVTPQGPNVTSGGPKVDLDQLYQPSKPTSETDLKNPPPPTAGTFAEPGDASAPVQNLGGGASYFQNLESAGRQPQNTTQSYRRSEPNGEPLTDKQREQSNNTDKNPPPPAAGTASQATARPRVRFDFIAPESGHRIAVDAPRWPAAWPGGVSLAVDHVLVCDPGDVRQVALLSAQDVAELLWAGLPRAWICWNPAWLQAEPGTDLYAELWDDDADRRENMVEDLLAIMQANEARWGHWDLIEALRRCGLAPERSQQLFETYGRLLVGAWLADLRQDPTVQSVAAVLISNLRKGVTPPGLARRSRPGRSLPRQS